LLLASRSILHHPHAGLNPLVDSTAHLFTLIEKLKHCKSYAQLTQWQKELKQEVHRIQETTQHHYSTDYAMICLYIICVTIDDLVSHSVWERQWQRHRLLTAFHQDTEQPFTFFTILERITQEPTHYIDLMELMYICLSMGYKGSYHTAAQGQQQLEQMKHHLYQHIRAYRGHTSQSLSALPRKTPILFIKTKPHNAGSLFYIFIVTACLIMIIFVSLGYLMDRMTNESYSRLSTIENTISHETG
jgi:type VI secretion system protein ImpK